MNKVILMGRPTRTPEVRYSGGSGSEDQKAVARITLAVDRRFKRQGEEQTADYISCVAFGKNAEFIERWIKQGTKIVCCGRIQTGSYTNKDGVKVYTTDVVLDEIEFAESKGSSTENNNHPAPSSSVGDGFMNIPEGIEEELPFS